MAGFQLDDRLDPWLGSRGTIELAFPADKIPGRPDDLAEPFTLLEVSYGKWRNFKAFFYFCQFAILLNLVHNLPSETDYERLASTTA